MESTKLPNPSLSVIARYSIRSKTNDGEYCKQTFSLIKANKPDTVLSIHKLVLTDRFELYEKYGYENLKQFKNQRLYEQVFGIKLKTLNEVLVWLNGVFRT